jgi:hypothetical protein
MYTFCKINTFKQIFIHSNMGFWEKLFGERPSYAVYCQGCNLDITALGGYVSTDGKAYCGRMTSEHERCIAGSRGLPTPADAEELQRAIRKKHLKLYSPLEQNSQSPRTATRKFSLAEVQVSIR